MALFFVTFSRAVRTGCRQAANSRNNRSVQSRASRPFRRRAPTFGAVTIGAALLFVASIAIGYAPVPPGSFSGSAGERVAAAGQPTVRTVNIPHLTSPPAANQTAVFWFGSVSPTATYSDVRIAYTDAELSVFVTTIDRLLWYNTTNPQQDLTAWDADSLFLDTGGPTGAAPAASAFRFDAQLNQPPGTASTSPPAWQASFRGNGSSWAPASLPFTTQPGWRGTALNSTLDSKGWTMTFHIPFASLGLTAPPPPGTAWALGLVNHNRDSAAGPPLGDTPWPESLAPTVPASWGRLVFGLPAYQPPTTTNNRTLTIQHKLNGAVVPDADVGGYTTCGGALDYWTQWGNANYAGGADFNIQNESDISDYPCFAKYYVTFPLSSLPAGQGITAATLTLHAFGGSGAPGQATPSQIEVSTVREDWAEASVSWNNGPYALENVAVATVAPLTTQPPWPGVARSWDVSRAVAAAYASGQPLRLALYSADTDYHSGKYFVSSDTGDWNAAGRPTLSVTFGSLTGAGSPTAPPVPPSPRPAGSIAGSPNPLPAPRRLGITGATGGPVPDSRPGSRP